MRVRIEDVANRAGVSMKTVSRVLNNEPGVREATRAKVLETVAAMNYRPDPSARSLAGNRSYLVALLYDNPSPNYLMEILTGVVEARNPRGAEYGDGRLARLLRRARSTEAEPLLSTILEDVRAFASDTPAEDDLTAVVARLRRR